MGGGILFSSETLESRFGVEVDPLFCQATKEKSLFLWNFQTQSESKEKVLGSRNQRKIAPRNCPLQAQNHAFFATGLRKWPNSVLPSSGTLRFHAPELQIPQTWLSAIPKHMPSYKGIPWIALLALLPYRKVPAANGKQPARLLPQTKRKLKTTNSFFWWLVFRAFNFNYWIQWPKPM